MNRVKLSTLSEVEAQYAAMTPAERREMFRAAAARNRARDTELQDAYIEYVVNVSPDWMAMSFNAAQFLSELCEQHRPGVVADFGSGFSSFVLRRYAARYGAQVWSVDDDPEWLSRTREFLGEYGLPVDRLNLWSEWVDSDGPALDVAFHDLGCGTIRESSMWPIADRMRPGGFLVFDDAQNDSHYNVMFDVAAAHGWALRLLPVTRDGNGRYDAMCVCRASSLA